jgi:hypothetical protein
MTTQQPTTETTAATPTASEQPESPPVAEITAPAARPQQAEADTLANLTYRDIPKFKDQIRKLDEVTPERLQEIIYGTVVSLIQDLGVEVYRLRAWDIDRYLAINASLDEVATRVEELEALLYGQDSQLTEADAELYTTIASACEGFVDHALGATHDPEGRSKLEALKEMCTQAKARIDETVIADDDDDDEGGESGG